MVQEPAWKLLASEKRERELTSRPGGLKKQYTPDRILYNLATQNHESYDELKKSSRPFSFTKIVKCVGLGCYFSYDLKIKVNLVFLKPNET